MMMLWRILYMGGCQNDGPFLGTLHIRCRIIRGSETDHNFDKHPYILVETCTCLLIGSW